MRKIPLYVLVGLMLAPISAATIWAQSAHQYQEQVYLPVIQHPRVSEDTPSTPEPTYTPTSTPINTPANTSTGTPRNTPTATPTETSIHDVRIEEDDPNVALTGDWDRMVNGSASGGSYIVSSTSGAALQFSFRGDSLTLYRTLDTEGGIADVMIDGQRSGVLYFYFHEKRWQVPAIFDNLGEGEHTLTLTNSHAFHPELADLTLGENVYIDAFSSLHAHNPTLAQQQAVDRVNWYRETAGLPPVRLHDALNMAAESHAQYIRINGWEDIHEQDPNKPGYVGSNSSRRAAYFGYLGGGVSQNLHWLGNPIPAIDEFIATVNHRNPILVYSLAEIGFSVNVDTHPNDVLEMVYDLRI